MGAERSPRGDRLIALAAAWLSLGCIGGPVIAVLVQILGLFLWPDDGITDEFAIGITVIDVLPRFALLGVPIAVVAVIVGRRVLRAGGGSTALGIAIPSLVLCALISALALAAGMQPIPY